MQDIFIKQLQQHFIEATQFHDGAVVLLHESLDAQPVFVIEKVKGFRQCALVVE